MATLEHDVSSARAALDALRAAEEANRPEEWQEARARLTTRLAAAHAARDRARAHQVHAPKQQLEAALESLAEVEFTASSIDNGPSGIEHIANERDIEALLDTPSAGTARARFDAKEQALRAELARLDPADTRRFARCISSPRSNDRLAMLFRRLIPERRDRLVAFLHDARRRQAISRERESRGPPEQLRGEDREQIVARPLRSLGEIAQTTFRFVAVRESGGVTRSAARLGMSHVALSRWLYWRGRR